MPDRPDRSLAELARRQRGLVTTPQLRRLGLSPGMVLTRVRNGHLVPVHRGVYAVGGRDLDDRDQVLAGVLAAGPGAVASHASAALLWELPCVPDVAVEVTVAAGRRPRIPGVSSHRTRHLTPADRAVVDGVPVTSAARTLVDLSRRLDDATWAAVLDDAWRRRLATPARVDRCAAQLGRGRGRSRARVVRVLEDRVGTRRAQESELERRVWRLLRSAGLPLPVAQHVVQLPSGSRRLDLAWPARRLALECDGFEWHRTRSRFDDDRVRQNELVVAGWTVLRVTDAMSDGTILALVRPWLVGSSR